MDSSINSDPKTYAIIGAAMEAHRELGQGFLESVYQEALAIEFSSRDIPFEREKTIPITYKGTTLTGQFRADFICYGDIIVELKTVDCFDKMHFAQILNYLKATNLNVGLLVNFKCRSL